jgi:phage gpG-like protein
MIVLRVNIEGMQELQRRLKQMNPRQNMKIIRNGLIESALKIQRNAAKEQILAGGGGKKNAKPPVPHQLTSRTGTLRRSIKVDRGPLPLAIEVGTDLEYGAVHEFGGTISVPGRVIRAHQRSIAFGKKVAPFTVPSHFRMGHYAEYPQRPFMKPALDVIAPQIPGIFIEAWRKEADL